MTIYFRPIDPAPLDVLPPTIRPIPVKRSTFQEILRVQFDPRIWLLTSREQTAHFSRNPQQLTYQVQLARNAIQNPLVRQAFHSVYRGMCLDVTPQRRFCRFDCPWIHHYALLIALMTNPPPASIPHPLLHGPRPLVIEKVTT
jgi:hypothetical protein